MISTVNLIYATSKASRQRRRTVPYISTFSGSSSTSFKLHPFGWPSNWPFTGHVDGYFTLAALWDGFAMQGSLSSPPLILPNSFIKSSFATRRKRTGTRDDQVTAYLTTSVAPSPLECYCSQWNLQGACAPWIIEARLKHSKFEACCDGSRWPHRYCWTCFSLHSQNSSARPFPPSLLRLPESSMSFFRAPNRPKGMTKEYQVSIV